MAAGGVYTPRSGVTEQNVASWGIATPHISAAKQGLPSGGTGVVTSWEESGDFRAGELQNEVGSLIGRAVYDVVRNVTCTLQTNHLDNLPQVGQYIQVGGKFYWIKQARISEQNAQYARLSLTLESSTYSNNTGFQQNLVTV